jgi:hypothetical protein
MNGPVRESGAFCLNRDFVGLVGFMGWRGKALAGSGELTGVPAFEKRITV